MATTSNPLVFLLLYSIFIQSSYPSPASATIHENLSFNFTSLSLQNLSLLGDSFLRNGIIVLTSELGVPSSSSGAVALKTPVPFLDPQSNTTASFYTRFVFSIANFSPAASFNGMAFFLSPQNPNFGSPNGYPGIVNFSLSTTENKSISVEFGTRSDSRTPNQTHIGLTFNNLGKLDSADTVSQGIDFITGNLITSWIEYNNELADLKVFLSNSDSKPKKPILDVHLDLSKSLEEFMYVGFSAMREGSTECYSLQNWTFQTYGFHRRHSRPHNVSETIIIRPPISIPRNAKALHRKLRWGLGISCPAFFGALLLLFGYMTVKKWENAKKKSFKTEFLCSGPREFAYKDLKTATKGFHSSRAIGHGAFGTVYKAFFASGTVSAVKRSKHSTHDSKSEFLAELSIIMCLRHKNLVPLLGWCAQNGELLLVYEYMTHGSLDKLLYEEEETHSGAILTWSQRFNIIMGLASVLIYLHHECEHQVIHRDIKTSNIMLDAHFNARLGDFGLARLADRDKSPISTLTAGTMGYLAPEYLQYGKATEKTDVFSFGVVVLEVGCGRRPIVKEGEPNLVDWVWGFHGEGRIIDAADERLKRQFEEEGMRKLLLVGLSCANPDMTKRPSMRRVFQILNGDEELVVVPRMKPSLSFSFTLPLSLDTIVGDDED